MIQQKGQNQCQITLCALSNSTARTGLATHAHYAGLVCLRADQLQVDPLCKHAFPIADGDRMDHQHVLINQTKPHKRLCRANAARHAQGTPKAAA